MAVTMERERVYAGIDAKEAQRLAVMRNHYRATYGLDVQPQRVRMVQATKDHIKTLLGHLQPDEAKLVLAQLTSGRGKRRSKARR